MGYYLTGLRDIKQMDELDIVIAKKTFEISVLRMRWNDSYGL